MFGLSININAQNSNENLPGYYWTDHVTEQPEGFDIDDNGNVSISTREGLAWLVSTVNGLNGQEPNDYEGLVVTLNDDLHDLDYYTWVPIGTSDNPFRGTFDGQNFIIDAIYMEDSEEGTNFGLFGTLDSAVIKRVTLGDRCIIYSYENSGGIAYLADNNTIIDECYVSVNMSVNNTSGGIVCINRDSKISNCCFNPYRYEIDGSYNGGIAGQNISVNSDAIIENSYVVTPFLEDEYYSHTAGIVGKNITESNNHKAIIRNCYAVPLYLQGEGCSGITSYNSENSIIENCYTNRDFDLCAENYGEIINCTVFDEDLQFDEIIEVFDVSASELTTALNLWTNHNPYNGRYLSWKYISDAMNYGYPILYPNPPLPEYYWTDLVTSQPEGYDVDESGNIHIYSAEALAWVSVLSNGLHGNEVEDFEGLTITLEEDIDLSGAKWSPIGGMEVMSEVYPFRGTFNGNNKVINNVILTNAPGNNHSNGFFRLLEGAHVCDVIMKDAYYEGNIMDGGFFAYSCENSKISRCLVECSYSILGGSMSLFINKVNSSIIHDCVMMAPLVFDGYDQTVCGTFVGYNNEGSHIYNCVSIVDRMCWTEGIGLVGYHNLGKIENCHVYIKEIIGYPGYGGGPGPRNGITEYNYGEILNCYYNCDIYSEEWGSTIISDLDNLPAYHNSGIIENTYSYIKEDGYCKLSESIVYNGNSTDNLLDALEFGVEELVQNGYACEDWCETSLIFDNLGLPFVCTFSEITNIDENSTDSDLMAIYPNPTENNITIEAEDIIQIEVYNTLGQMVARIGAEGNSVELDMSDYSDGIYLIKTVSKEGSTVSRVVKM